MTTSDSSPFRAHHDWEHNACVNNYMQFTELSHCYTRSGDEIVESTLRDHSLLDVHVYAVCFLYRHALELYLKDIIWKSHYALTAEKRYAADKWQELGRHRLHELWTSAEKNTTRLLGDYFPLDRQQRQKLSALLTKCEQHDPESYSFRYPIGKRGRTHPELRNVNVRALREGVHEVLGWLANLAERVEYHYDQRSEMERVRR